MNLFFFDFSLFIMSAASSTAVPNEPLPRIFMKGVDMSTLSPEVVGFIQTVRMLDEDICELSLSGGFVKHRIAEMFPPGVLFSHGLLCFPILHQKLRLA